MVPIEQRLDYIRSVNRNDILNAFYNFLWNESLDFVKYDTSSNDTTNIYFNLIKSLNESNKEVFVTCYSKISNRTPNKEYPQPFVNNDYLIFIIIIGVVKFNIDKNWITEVVMAKSRNITSTTFENIITENFFSKTNRIETVVVFLYLTDNKIITNNHLKDTYKSIVKDLNLFESKNDFNILISLRALDIFVEQIELSDNIELNELKMFEDRFLQRMKRMSVILYNLLFLPIVYGLVSLLQVLILDPEIAKKIDVLDKVLGILGVGAISSLIAPLRKSTTKFFCKVFGYPKPRYNKIHKN